MAIVAAVEQHESEHVTAARLVGCLVELENSLFSVAESLGKVTD